jgi:transcriptional regulator with XRE-family HTH domain
VTIKEVIMEMEEFLAAVGRRIEKVRELRTMSRRDLGMAVGMNEASANAGVYALETGGRGTQIDTIFKVAKALNVTPGFLLDGGELTMTARV